MLKLSKLQLKLHFTTPARLPYWLGSMFRGVFGNEVRRMLCNNLDMACIDCCTKDDCLYYYMYERSVAKRGYAPPQRPIIIIPPFFGKVMSFEKDGYLNIEILLFGEYIKFIPHVLLALRLSGQDGLGAERHYGLNRFEISSAQYGLSDRHIFDGSKLDLANLKVIDIQDLPIPEIKEYKIGFKTPLSQTTFPPSPEQLINLIRNRLIRFVNEYGDSTKIQK